MRMGFKKAPASLFIKAGIFDSKEAVLAAAHNRFAFNSRKHGFLHPEACRTFLDRGIGKRTELGKVGFA